MSAHEGMWGRRAVTAVTTLALISGGGVSPALAASLGIEDAPIAAQAASEITLSKSNTKISIPETVYTGEEIIPEVLCSDASLAQARNLDVDTEYTLTITKFVNADGEEESASAIQNAGTYTVEVEGVQPFKGKLTETLTVDKCEISLVNVKAGSDATKEYDGTTDVPVGNAYDAEWAGLPEGVTLTYKTDWVITDTPAPQLADKNVGKNKAVTFNYELAGDAAKNFELSAGQFTSYIEVTPAPLTVTLDGDSFEYNGKEQAPTATITDGTIFDGDDAEVTVSGAQTDAGDKYVATATLEGKDAGNYELTVEPEDGQEFEITKAQPDVKKEPTAAQALAADGTSHELIVPGESKDGTFKYIMVEADKDDGTIPSADDSKSKWSDAIPTATEAGDYNVYWMLVGDKNHESTDPAGPITVTIQDRSAIKTEPKAIEGLVYNADEQVLVTEGEAENKGDKIVYFVTDTTVVDAPDAGDFSKDIHDAFGVGAKTYRVWYTVMNKQGEVNTDLIAYVDVEIAKKSVTATITGAERDYDGTNVVTEAIKEAAFGDPKNVTIEGVIDDENVEISFADNFKAFAEDKNAGENKSVKMDFVELTGADAANYELADADVTATVTINPLKVWATGIEAEDKVYDGTTDAVVKAGKNFKTNLDSVKLEDDDVAVDTDSLKGAFEDANVGEGKTVKFELAFKGADAGNYIFDSNASQADTKANITAGSLENAEIKLSDTIFSYDGNAKTPAVLVTIDGKVVATTDYSVAYANNVEIGTATVTVTGVKNLEGTKTATFQIVKGRKFIDVNDATPHHNDIDWLAATGISEGWDNGDGTYSFKPMASNARADMAAFMFRLAVNEGIVSSDWQPENYDAFVDVDESTPHAREIAWLASVGVSKGWADGTFRPYQTIARCDMAAFLHRFAALSGRGAGVQGKSFSDVTSSTPHAEDIEWLGGSGISIGFPDGTFRALNDVVRQDMAAFLHRLDNLA